MLAAAAVLLAAVVLAGSALISNTPSPPPTTWISVLPPPAGFSHEVNPAVSPDGRTIAFVALGAAGEDRLWLRDLGTLTLRNMPGTEGATQPFWSPDGKWVGFFARGKLKKAPVADGSPQVLADAPLPRGGTWNTRGDILFNPTSFVPIYRTTAGGAPATPLQLSVPFDTQDHRQSFPRFLPDGRHFLFASGPSIAVGSIDSPDVKEIASIPSIAIYADGHLLFVRDGDLFAQSFDVTRLALSGEPTKIADNIGWSSEVPMLFAFNASSGGVVAYWDRSAIDSSQLTWFDRAGTRQGSVGEPGEYVGLALSPDSRHVGVELHEPHGGRVSVWMMDVATGARSRFTSYANWTAMPLWSADSSRLLVTDFSEHLHVLPLAGGSPQEIAVGGGGKWPTDWSRDGRFVVYVENRETTGLGIVRTDGTAPASLLQTPFNEAAAKISPDGSRLALASDESGRSEVYVQAFPKAASKIRISTNGGAFPVWRPDGRALFFITASGELVEAELSTVTTGLEVRTVHTLFHPPPLNETPYRTPYAIAEDGQRFLMNVVVPDDSPKAITVILNWKTGLK